MDSAPGSGLIYPNNLARITLLALEDVMGINGVHALLRLASTYEFIDKLPQNNTESEVDFTDFSIIFAALDEMYGTKGGRLLALRVGMATFDESLKNIGEAVDVNDTDFVSLPIAEKARVGLSLIGITFLRSTKNLPIIQEDDEKFIYSVINCPNCWGRTTDDPSCHFVSGLIKGSLKWVTRGVDFQINQIAAHSCGAKTCDFVIPKNPV